MGKRQTRQYTSLLDTIVRRALMICIVQIMFGNFPIAFVWGEIKSLQPSMSESYLNLYLVVSMLLAATNRLDNVINEKLWTLFVFRFRFR